MSEHSTPPVKHEKRAVLIAGAVVLAVLALVGSSVYNTLGKADSEDQVDELVEERLSTAELIQRACMEGGQTAIDLGSACSAARAVVISPEAIEGKRGEPGLSGPPGPQGIDGPPGPAGKRGAQGDVGPRGAGGAPGQDGPSGPAGPQGDVGPRGVDGAPGQDGKSGADGAPGATGEKGEKGDPGPTCPAGFSPTETMVLTPSGTEQAVICRADPPPS